MKMHSKRLGDVFKCIRGGSCIEIVCENGKNHRIADSIHFFCFFNSFCSYFASPSGRTHFLKNMFRNEKR